MRIEQLLTDIENGSVCFAGVTHDSRNVQPGYIFVAIPGKTHDGHQYIREAIEKGAACIVSEHITAEPSRIVFEPAYGKTVPVCLTESARQWLGPLAAAVYRHPSRAMGVIGITGSNGKTTIATMIHSFFAEQGISCGLIGTVENEINGIRTQAVLTTPEAPDLQKMLFDLRQADTRQVVMEVSAQGVEMGRIEGTDFSIGIFTNLTLDHLDFHADMNEYLAAKIRFMKRLEPDKIAIYNWDDPVVKLAALELQARTFSYSVTDGSADLSIQALEKDDTGSRFFLKIGPVLESYTNRFLEVIPFHVSLPGLHNVSNALSAILAGIVSGIEPLVMKRTLANFKPVTRRMQQTVWQGINIIDDTAMNPGSIRAVLDSFRLEPYKRVILAFAIRGNRGVDVNRENAIVLRNWYTQHEYRSPCLIITSSLDFTSPNDRVSMAEETVFLETLRQYDIPYTFHARLTDAMEQVSRRAGAGDILFLLGAQGMDEGFHILSQYGKIKDLVNG